MQSLQKSFFQLRSRLSPKAAANWAVRRWSTPAKYKLSSAEKLLMEAAGKKRIPIESKYSNSGNIYYTLYGWGKGPAVLLVHDWGGCGAQLASFAQPLVKAGYQVITFDALAHGDSPGKQSDLTEMVAVIKDIGAKFKGFEAVIGHSLGALAAAIAIQDGVRISKLVAISAATSLDYVLRQFANELGASRELRGRVSVLVTKRLRMNIKDLSLVHISARINCSLLIIHDQEDKVIDHREALALSKCWPGSELIMTTGLGHAGLLKSPKIMQEIIRYLTKARTAQTNAAAWSSDP